MSSSPESPTRALIRRQMRSAASAATSPGTQAGDAHPGARSGKTSGTESRLEPRTEPRSNSSAMRHASLSAFVDPNPMSPGAQVWLGVILILLVVVDLAIAARVMGWPHNSNPDFVLAARTLEAPALPTPPPAPVQPSIKPVAPVAGHIVRSPPASLHVSLTRGLVRGLSEANQDPALADAVTGIFSRDWNLRSLAGRGRALDLLIEPSRQDASIRTDFGRITAARLTVGRRVYEAFRFIQADGRYGYYRANGAPTTRPMMRSPSVFDLSMANLGPKNGWNRSAASSSTAHRPVLSLLEGVVVRADPDGDAGWRVEIRHPDGWLSRYMGLDSVRVQAGNRVGARQIIGEVTEDRAMSERHYALTWGSARPRRAHRLPAKLQVTTSPTSFSHAVRHARTAWDTHAPDAFASDD